MTRLKSLLGLFWAPQPYVWHLCFKKYTTVLIVCSDKPFNAQFKLLQRVLWHLVVKWRYYTNLLAHWKQQLSVSLCKSNKKNVDAVEAICWQLCVCVFGYWSMQFLFIWFLHLHLTHLSLSFIHSLELQVMCHSFEKSCKLKVRSNTCYCCYLYNCERWDKLKLQVCRP